VENQFVENLNFQILVNAFKPFGNIRIEWPNKDNLATPKGYLYIIFDHEKQVSFVFLGLLPVLQ
jgi:cytoplasmic polyadenylation element-binding protein